MYAVFIYYIMRTRVATIATIRATRQLAHVYILASHDCYAHVRAPRAELVPTQVEAARLQFQMTVSQLRSQLQIPASPNKPESTLQASAAPPKVRRRGSEPGRIPLASAGFPDGPGPRSFAEETADRSRVCDPGRDLTHPEVEGLEPRGNLAVLALSADVGSGCQLRLVTTGKLGFWTG